MIGENRCKSCGKPTRGAYCTARCEQIRIDVVHPKGGTRPAPSPDLDAGSIAIADDAHKQRQKNRRDEIEASGIIEIDYGLFIKGDQRHRADDIRYMIRKGILQDGARDGDRIPTVAQIAQAITCSKAIVSRVCKILEVKGMLYRHPRLGWVKGRNPNARR